ncbi:MAG: trimethylamine methyltransferase family protein [Desulfohalobiaceae bacterium]|nr:trimethylamine methyltransferase family protein [Desulfohalobiaceae bacterium]
MKPELRFFSHREIDLVHASALDVLRDVGMRLPSREALSALEQEGAGIEGEDLARIPPQVVDKALKSVPKRGQAVLYARDPDWDISFAEHDPLLSCMTMATSVLDPESGERRSATSEDLARLTRIAEQCDNIGVSGGLVTPQEVPRDYNDWYTWAICLQNSRKHVTGGMYGASCVRDAAEMASLAVGGMEAFRERPFISGWVLTLPPFNIDQASLEAMVEMSRWNIPSIISSGPMLGASSPVDIPTTCVQAHAEILACLTVTQLINPGAPVVYTSFARGMDMRTGGVTMGGPEFAVLKGAMSQMGRYLDLPVRMPGMLRDAKILDAQAGFETGLTGSPAALGADLIDSMQLDSDLMVDFADPVFCNECMGALKRMVREMDLERDGLNLDLLREVGPGGTFMMHEHTFQNFQTELWFPEITEHRDWEVWKQDGAPDIRSKALKRAKEMMDRDTGGLAPETRERIDRVVEKVIHGS